MYPTGGKTTKGTKTTKWTATATASHAKSQRRQELRLATESTEGHGREDDWGSGVVGGEPLACVGLEGGGLTAKGTKDGKELGKEGRWITLGIEIGPFRVVPWIPWLSVQRVVR